MAGSLPVNGARGEVALRIGTVDLVIAAEIGRLAAVSTALECKSFVDLYERLLNAEVAAVLAAVRHLTVSGNVEQAVAEMRLADFPACRDGIARALGHHVEASAGKAPGRRRGRGGKATNSPSHSVAG